jgi:hypothetical protein
MAASPIRSWPMSRGLSWSRRDPAGKSQRKVFLMQSTSATSHLLNLIKHRS